MTSRTVTMVSGRSVARRARSRKPCVPGSVPAGAGIPWRGSTDPYAILVSEVMLQQTQASRVVPDVRAVPRPVPDRAGPRAGPAGRRRALVGRARLQPPRGGALRDGAVPGPGPRWAGAARPGSPAPAPGHRRLHGGGGRIARVRRTRRGARHERPARRRAGVGGARRRGARDRRPAQARRAVARPRRSRDLEPGAHGPRSRDLPSASAVRRLSDRVRLPVPGRGRHAGSGSAQAGPVRWFITPGARGGGRCAPPGRVLVAGCDRSGHRVLARPGPRSRRRASARRARRGRSGGPRRVGPPAGSGSRAARSLSGRA